MDDIWDEAVEKADSSPRACLARATAQVDEMTEVIVVARQEDGTLLCFSSPMDLTLALGLLRQGERMTTDSAVDS